MAGGESARVRGMAEKHEVVARLQAQLALGSELRASAMSGGETMARRLALRQWQSERLARTHADLLELAAVPRGGAVFPQRTVRSGGSEQAVC